MGLQLESSQVVNVLVVGPVQLFPFLWFSGGCVFSSCCLRFVVALCFRGLSPCVLICNLWTYVSLTVPTAWSADMFICIVKINGIYYLQIFPKAGGCWFCGSCWLMKDKVERILLLTARDVKYS